MDIIIDILEFVDISKFDNNGNFIENQVNFNVKCFYLD